MSRDELGYCEDCGNGPRICSHSKTRLKLAEKVGVYMAEAGKYMRLWQKAEKKIERLEEAGESLRHCAENVQFCCHSNAIEQRTCLAHQNMKFHLEGWKIAKEKK